MKVDLDWLHANTSVRVMTSRYCITKYKDELGIWCRTCNMLSFSGGDVSNKYCGKCHCFHDDGSLLGNRPNDWMMERSSPARGDKLSVTLNGFTVLVEHGAGKTSLYDTNGTHLFDVPRKWQADDVLVALNAYLRGREIERLKRLIEERG